MRNLKSGANELSYKARVPDAENRHGYQQIRGEGINWDPGTDIQTLLDVK